MYRRLIVIAAVLALFGQAVLLPAVALGGAESSPEPAPSVVDGSPRPGGSAVQRGG